MSDIDTQSARFISMVEQLKGAMIAAAVICVLVFSAAWLVDRPAEVVRAESEATSDLTPIATAQASRVVQTPSPSPTATVEPTLLPSPTPQATATPDDRDPTPTVVPSGHTVRAGETLTGIARTYDISVDELLVLNDMPNRDLLYVGQELILPASATARSTPAPSSTPAPDGSSVLPSLASPDEMIAGRWIDVDISERRLTAYEASVPVRTTLVSTGLPATPTPIGQFRIWIRLRFDDMAGADYYIEDVPYVMYFHEGYGLHRVTWHGNFGHPMSHGCVNLPTTEAEWLYNWAEVGTLVNIHQ